MFFCIPFSLFSRFCVMLVGLSSLSFWMLVYLSIVSFNSLMPCQGWSSEMVIWKSTASDQIQGYWFRHLTSHSILYRRMAQQLQDILDNPNNIPTWAQLMWLCSHKTIQRKEAHPQTIKLQGNRIPFNNLETSLWCSAFEKCKISLAYTFSYKL